MASPLEKDLSCPVCRDIFIDPVVLSCSHSFCKHCLHTWWKERLLKECPVCKGRPLLSDPPRNLVLKNLCEAFKLERDQKGTEPLCSLHSEKFKLFCLDHQQPVCSICRDSKAHNNHKFRPIDEAAQDHREELQKTLELVQDKLKIFEQVKGNCDQTAEHIKVQAQDTEGGIKEQFKKLHQFLQEEEEARISALREEELKKTQMMKDKIETLNREITALSDTIRATEEQLRAEDISFLQNYKATIERVQQCPLPDSPEVLPGAPIDVAKHLDNLAYNIWNKMKKMVSYTPTPVTPDPKSTEPSIAESENISCCTTCCYIFIAFCGGF